jgi:hypothetical protein
VDERTRKIAELLHEAGEIHHTVYRIVDGADDDWASFYSNWLITLSELPELPELLGAAPVRSELTYMLVKLDKDYETDSPDQPWEDWYAERLVEHFAPDA